MYCMLIKNGIGMQKIYCKNIDEVNTDIFDSCEEISEKEFNSLQLPCKKVNGEWAHTEEYPVIEYPVSEPVEQEPTIEEQVTNIQELVVQQQYELELLKLGIEV